MPVVLTARAIIDVLGLVPLPEEGGMYRQTFLADETVAVPLVPTQDNALRSWSARLQFESALAEYHLRIIQLYR